jgi:iron complex outermembrane receptor protein
MNRLAFTTSLIALAWCGQAAAQTQPSTPARSDSNATQNDSNVIVVTATRRTERLQEVPLSVTAFSQEELTELGIVGYEGIAQNTPGVVVNRPTQNFNNFTARGINTNGYSAGMQSAVAI